MGKNWEVLSMDERSEEMFNSWMAPKDVSFESSEAQTAYKKRTKRIKDVIELKVPDRVPFWFSGCWVFPLPVYRHYF